MDASIRGLRKEQETFQMAAEAYLHTTASQELECGDHVSVITLSRYEISFGDRSCPWPFDDYRQVSAQGVFWDYVLAWTGLAQPIWPEA